MTVRASGFAPAEQVLIEECATGSPALNRCDLEDSVTAIAGATGDLRARLPVTASSPARGDPTVDCNTTSCSVLAVAEQDRWYESGRRISFDPDLPPVEPSITVQPSTDLTPGENVTVTGSGFLPGIPISIGQCPVDDPQVCLNSGNGVEATANGTFTAGTTIKASVYGGKGNGSPKCAGLGTTNCQIAIFDQNDPNPSASITLSSG